MVPPGCPLCGQRGIVLRAVSGVGGGALDLVLRAVSRVGGGRPGPCVVRGQGGRPCVRSARYTNSLRRFARAEGSLQPLAILIDE